MGTLKRWQDTWTLWRQAFTAPVVICFLLMAAGLALCLLALPARLFGQAAHDFVLLLACGGLVFGFLGLALWLCLGLLLGLFLSV